MCYCDCFAGLFANFLMSVNSNEPHNSVIQITGIPSVGLNATPRNGPTYDQLLCLYFLSTKWAQYPIVPTCESFPAVLFLFRKPNEQSNKAHGRLTVWQVTSKSHLIIETKHRHPPPLHPPSHLVTWCRMYRSTGSAWIRRKSIWASSLIVWCRRTEVCYSRRCRWAWRWSPTGRK